MQTNFTAEKLRSPDIVDAQAILTDCVHYGFCTAVCPTYVLLHDELDAPRGRIDLIHEMLESDDPPSARTVGYIDRCLSCNSCMSTCAAKVDYMHLADIARAHIEKNYRRPVFDRLFRKFIAKTVPNFRLFRLSVRLACICKPFANFLPERLRNLLKLSPEFLPPANAAVSAGVYPAKKNRNHRVILLTGCVQQALAPHINHATINLLTRHGCEVIVDQAMSCCGAFTLHMGMDTTAKSNANKLIFSWAQVIERAKADGTPIDAIIVNASGCGTTIKDYDRIFTHDPKTAKLAEQISSLTMDITEFISKTGLRTTNTAIPLDITYHDACSLQHAQKVTKEPRDLLKACGFIVHDVPEAHFCCGSAGAYNMLEPVIAAQLGARKVEHVESTNGKVLVAGNLGCLNQMGLYTNLPTLHTVEMLDWATGGPCPQLLKDMKIPQTASLTDKPPNNLTSGGIGIW
ncbi:MAG: glycolate oxidase subunit GlcF [Pseudomonadota bacterium]|nr:glycolate oxidase subunit GlcF [Pseudomonadota bacterium]